MADTPRTALIEKATHAIISSRKAAKQEIKAYGE
jgi:hypothetical protein